MADIIELLIKLPRIRSGASTDEIIGDLDPILAHQHHVPVHERPSVILHKILMELDEVDTDTIEEEIRSCYVDRFPNTTVPGLKRVLSVLLVRGTAFSLRIPTETM